MALSALLTILLAFGSTVLCIIVLKAIAPRLGLVDLPDARKAHKGAIPLVGGISIWLAFTICLLFVGLTAKTASLILSGGLLVIIGAVDDFKELSPLWRLVLHIAAALVMCVFGGVVVLSLGDLIIPGTEFTLGVLAIPFTVFAVVALINATNMSDGLDGLCGLQVFIPLAGLAVLSGIVGDHANFLPLIALCGCLLGFLFFNLRTPWRRRASVFLGDAGSNFLGLALAWFLIDMSQGPDAVLQPVAVLFFAPLLIYDTVEIVTRRLVRGESPFAADREHLHHVFLLAKFAVPETVLTMSAITLISVVVGVSTYFMHVPDSALFGAFILVGLLFLRMIFRTWRAMRFLYRSICRRRGERRQAPPDRWPHLDRRSGSDRRRRATEAAREQQDKPAVRSINHRAP